MPDNDELVPEVINFLATLPEDNSVEDSQHIEHVTGGVMYSKSKFVSRGTENGVQVIRGAWQQAPIIACGELHASGSYIYASMVASLGSGGVCPQDDSTPLTKATFK